MLSTAPGVNHYENLIIWQLCWSNYWTFALDDPALVITTSETDWEMKSEAEEMKLHSMAKVQNIVDIWKGSQNIYATQKESRAQNKQIAAMEYIQDTQKVCHGFRLNFEHIGVAVF
jgi:hypothetical protein